MTVRRQAATAVIAIIGVVTSFAATCAAGAMAAEQEQMACCKAGHHRCGTPAKPADCCKTHDSHEQQVTLVKADPLKQPTWTAIAWLAPVWWDSFTPAIVRPVPVVDTSPPLRPDRPAYITFSVLLI